MTFFERALNLYKDLETVANQRAREFEGGTRANELFSLLGQYYFFMWEASLLRHSAAFEITVKNDRGAAERALEWSVFRFEGPEVLKQEFQAELRD